jgi:DNA-binding transcriptional ArsR family regulator
VSRDSLTVIPGAHLRALERAGSALGDRTRIAILLVLLECGQSNCSEVHRALGEAGYSLSIQRLSQQLGRLRETGLIHSERRGRVIDNRLSEVGVAAIRWLALATRDGALLSRVGPKMRPLQEQRR